MLKWIPYVMVRVLIFFVAGILLGIYCPDFISPSGATLVFVILLLSYGAGFLLLKHTSWLPIISGLTGISTIFCAGYLMWIGKTDSSDHQHLSKPKKPIDFYVASVTNTPEKKSNGERVEVELRKVKSGGLWTRASGKILVYRRSDTTKTEGLKYGDEILVSGAPVGLAPPANPGEFDFRRFLNLKNIFHQQFVGPHQITLAARQKSGGILFYSQQAKAWATTQIRKFVPGTQEQAITLALVVGITEELDNDLQDAYAASGAMHVLSVSGLHVGIIYAIILLLLKPLSHFSWSRWLTAGLSLICLWTYAFVTGLSPSVLRAVMMFSFMVIARPFGRNTNIYNTLAASAFLLLLYDPHLVLSVGFQLSYLAVLGIVYLQRPLYNLWEPASLFWDKIWQITCVSVAAQGATFALGLYYFHQFPVYFLISNLLVIPLSTAVLVGGIVLLFLSPVAWLAKSTGMVLRYLVTLLNGSAFFIEDLPYSVVDGVQINGLQCWLLMGITAFIILLFTARKFKFLVYGMLCVIVFSILHWRHLFINLAREQLIVYQVPGHSAVEWLDGDQSYFYSDSALLHDERRIRFHIRPNRLLCGVKEVDSNSSGWRFRKSFQGFSIFLWKKNTVLLIDKPNADLPDRVTVDYLIIGNNSIRSFESIQHKANFKRVIFDSSNSRYYVAKMAREAGLKNISVHSVMDQGAFVINL